MQESDGHCVVQRCERQLLDARPRDRVVADTEQRHDGVGCEPARHEREYVNGWAVQQMGVVGDDQQRRGGGRQGEQFEGGQRDLKRVGGGHVLEPERRAQRSLLYGAEPFGTGQELGEQVVQAGEGQV